MHTYPPMIFLLFLYECFKKHVVITVIVCASRHPPRPAAGLEIWRVERNVENARKLFKSVDRWAKGTPGMAKMNPKER